MTTTVKRAISLEDRIQEVDNVVEMLRNVQAGSYPFPMKGEYSNWRDEQRSWRETAVLYDQSFHMTDVYFKGPDCKRLLSDIGINSMANYSANKAKQFVACNEDGYVIGDAIAFIFEEDEVSLVGRPTLPNWAAFNAETGDYEVEVKRDERTVENSGQRMTFRYQIQGPNALKIVERAHGGSIERIKCFNIGHFTIAGCPIRALNHTMSGVPGEEMTGLELMGPSEHRDAVLDSLIEAGQEYGLREGGARSYPSAAVESGWIPNPVAAIYTGESMKPFRKWLSGTGWQSLHRRKLQVRQHRGLLRHTVGSRLRACDQVRSRVHRPSSPRAEGRRATSP